MCSTGAGVWFSLNGTTYQNNSVVILEDIGEGDDDGLLCIAYQSACCSKEFTGVMGLAIGNWYFPNGTRVPSSGRQWDFHRTRGDMVVLLHRRRGGVDGVYRCVVADAMNVTQTIYIGVYTSSTGKQYKNILQWLCCRRVVIEKVEFVLWCIHHWYVPLNLFVQKEEMLLRRPVFACMNNQRTTSTL